MTHGSGDLVYDEELGHALFHPIVSKLADRWPAFVEIDLAAVPEHVVAYREGSENLNQAQMNMRQQTELLDKVRRACRSSQTARTQAETAEKDSCD